MKSSVEMKQGFYKDNRDVSHAEYLEMRVEALQRENERLNTELHRLEGLLAIKRCHEIGESE